MESKTLEEKFDQTRSVEHTQERLEQLLDMWIHPDFAHRLCTMCDEIKASAEEVMAVSWNIIAANEEISVENQAFDIKETNAKRWYLPGRFQNASNDDNYWNLAA